MKNILLTRPREHSQELVALLEKARFTTFIEPLFVVKKIAVIKKDPTSIDSAIITSANACDALINFGFAKDIQIFSVGKKTSQKLADAGFVKIFTAPNNSAKSLKDLITKTANKTSKIVYFHGSVVTLDFQNELEKSGFNITNILAYETLANENFSEEFLQISKEKTFDQVLLFSENSAKIFYKLVTKHNLLEYFASSQILCLSEKILDCVKKFGFTNSTTFAEFPILKKFYD